MAIGKTFDHLSPNGTRRLVVVPEWDYPGDTGVFTASGTPVDVKDAVAGKQHVLTPGSFHLVEDNTELITITIYSENGGAVQTIHWMGYFAADAKAGDVLPLDETLYGNTGEKLVVLVDSTTGNGKQVRGNLHGASFYPNSMV